MRLLFILILLMQLDASAQTALLIRDIDGFQYQTARLGTQTWMAQNLNVTQFRNGDPIPEAQTAEEWRKANLEGTPAWCYYKNDPENAAIYGKLYNWYAITDPRGIAPQKWHVPNQEEWNRMINFLGGKQKAGPSLKSSSGWNKGGNGSNQSNFMALPGGSRDENGSFLGMGNYGYFWTAQEQAAYNAWGCDLGYSYTQINRFSYQKGNGFSVRCVRD
jgi:uncharacterized protein (TIGR02145 family)